MRARKAVAHRRKALGGRNEHSLVVGHREVERVRSAVRFLVVDHRRDPGLPAIDHFEVSGFARRGHLEVIAGEDPDCVRTVRASAARIGAGVASWTDIVCSCDVIEPPLSGDHPPVPGSALPPLSPPPFPAVPVGLRLPSTSARRGSRATAGRKQAEDETKAKRLRSSRCRVLRSRRKSPT